VKTPNVNFFIHSVPYLNGVNDPLFKKYSKERKFYTCFNRDYNYLSYIHSGSKEKIDFIDYSGNNEKSQGLFDKDGICNKERIAELKKGFQNAKSPIWHGLISFEEKFGKQYCNNFEKAYELMKDQFSRFLLNAGFNLGNIVWCAGFHTNTEHRHIHFIFYEKEPLHYRTRTNKKEFSHGMVNLYAIQKVKIDMETYLTSINSKLIRQRTKLTEEFKKQLSQNLIQGELNVKMKQILLLIPTTGRISFNSENMMFLKPKINYLVDLIIRQNENVYATFQTFLTMLQDKDASIKRMCEASKIPFAKVLMFEKYEKDIYRRLGNIVIKHVLETRNQLKAMDYKTTNRLIKKRIEKQKNAYIFEQCLKLSEKVEKEAMLYFKEHMKTLEEMRLKVLIEQGVVEL